jgi:hypothetical protein
MDSFGKTVFQIAGIAVAVMIGLKLDRYFYRRRPSASYQENQTVPA